MRAWLDKYGGPAVIMAAGMVLAVAAHAVARPAPAVQLSKPTPPEVQPRAGRAFIPVQGDWEGTADGFTASFTLVLDTMRRQGAGAPKYGIEDLVLLRPVACPPDPSHYRESFLEGHLPSDLGAHGSLALDGLGLHGRFTGARTATLTAGYSLASCHGTQTWRMHPAVRRVVADGRWTMRYADGERSAFRVRSGGRLATGIQLPHLLAACNGLRGTLDLFVGVRGGSAFRHGGVTLSLRFADGSAHGTLSARGCGSRPWPVSAVRSGG